jgi:hypothetical protein
LADAPITCRHRAEYGPFAEAEKVAGVTYDGRDLWFAAVDRINAVDPDSGKIVRSIEVPAHAGTAFDGRHLYQIADDRIQKIDPKSGAVIATIPAPDGGGHSGLAWAEGSLWVGQYHARKIHQDRSCDRRRPAHDRIESLRHRRHVG